MAKHENASILGSPLHVHHCNIGWLTRVWTYVLSMLSENPLIGSADFSVYLVGPEKSLGTKDQGDGRNPSCKKAENGRIED